MHLLVLLVMVGQSHFYFIFEALALDLIVGLTVGLAISTAKLIGKDITIDFSKCSL